MIAFLLALLVVEATAVLIMAGEEDGSVAVFLHKLAVAPVVHIRSLEALSVLGLLDGLSVALAILVCALETGSVGVVYDDLPIDLPFTKSHSKTSPFFFVSFP